MQLTLFSPVHISTQKYTGAQEERAEKQNIGLLTRKKNTAFPMIVKELEATWFASPTF